MKYNELCCKDKNYFSIFQIIRHHFNLNSVHPQKKWNNLLSSAKVLHLVGVMPPFRALWRLSPPFSLISSFSPLKVELAKLLKLKSTLENIAR